MNEFLLAVMHINPSFVTLLAGASVLPLVLSKWCVNAAFILLVVCVCTYKSGFSFLCVESTQEGRMDQRDETGGLGRHDPPVKGDQRRDRGEP